jgi:replicative DNA helicase
VKAPRQHSDLDAEAAVLGGIMTVSQALARVHDLEVEDFYDPKHQLVFSAIRRIDEDGVDAIDPVTIGAELKRMGKSAALASVGDGGDPLGFLLALMLRPGTPDSVEHYARILKRHRVTRELRLAAASILEHVERGVGDEAEGEEAVQWALTRLMRIRSRAKDPGRHLGDLMLEELDQLDADLAAIERGENVVTGVSTGIRTLDDSIGGYPIGNVSLVMGATGHGKSTVLGASARAVAADDDFAFVYSHEDTKKFWAQRGIGQESGVPTEAIARRRNLDHALQMRAPGEFAVRRLALARKNAWRRREVIIPAAGWTVEDVISDARWRRARMQAEVGGRKRRLAVYLDYIQVVRLLFPRGIDSRTEAIALAMDRLQWLAQGCGVPDASEECAVIVSSQVKDAVVKEKRPPRLEDWSDSYSTVKVSKLVVGINRPAKYDRDANPLHGSLDVLKRNQGDDEVHADVILDLAIHTIRDVNDAPGAPAQTSFGGST